MVSTGRHPKQPVAAALKAVEHRALVVEEVHRGHRWGRLVCLGCGDDLPIWSTPRVPERLGDAIRRFDLRHRRCIEGYH